MTTSFFSLSPGGEDVKLKYVTNSHYSYIILDSYNMFIVIVVMFL